MLEKSQGTQGMQATSQGIQADSLGVQETSPGILEAHLRSREARHRPNFYDVQLKKQKSRENILYSSQHQHQGARPHLYYNQSAFCEPADVSTIQEQDPTFNPRTPQGSSQPTAREAQQNPNDNQDHQAKGQPPPYKLP